jgi:endonuclease/exonuclease/phosphatase family metal-dependent hydrolase
MFSLYCRWMRWLLCLIIIGGALPYGAPPAVAQEGGAVQFRLSTMRVANAQEDGIFSNGDEPYYLAIGFRSRFRTPNSTSTSWSGYLTELGHQSDGDTVDIPPEMGLVSFADVPLVTLDDIAAGRRFPELIGVLIVSMESDATPFSAIRDKANELKGALQDELRRLVEQGELNLSNLDSGAFEEATNRVKGSLAVGFWEGIGLWLRSWTDPDDRIGFHLYAYTPVDDELRGYVPTIEHPDVTFGPLTNQRYEIGMNPVVFAGDDARYEVTLDIASTASVSAVSIDCQVAPASLSQVFLPMVQAGANRRTGDQITRPLGVASYNVQFLTPWNGSAIPGHRPNTTERAEAIGQVLATYDIVALNETVNDDRRREIVEAMNRAAAPVNTQQSLASSTFGFVSGPQVIEPPIQEVGDVLSAILTRPGEPIFGDELTIVSRLPIVTADSYIYRARSGVDRLAAKGVLHVRVRDTTTASAPVLDIFATHIQAGGGDQIKRCQLTELAEYIRSRTSPDVPAILLGDFNIDGLRSAQVDPNSNYTYLTNLLTLHSGKVLRDIGRHVTVGTNIDSNGNQTRRIDHIFTSSPSLTVQEMDVAVNRFNDERWGTLSDHAAVTAKVTWLQSAPPPPPAPDLVVEAIATSGGQLHVTIANRGDAPVTNPFWTDLIIQATHAPAVPNDTWEVLGGRGMAWGVTQPLGVGERLTLSVGDTFYRADQSAWGGSILAGATLSAHIDSANTSTRYGAVLEIHERDGEPYNNVQEATAASPIAPPAVTMNTLLASDDMPARPE